MGIINTLSFVAISSLQSASEGGVGEFGEVNRDGWDERGKGEGWGRGRDWWERGLCRQREVEAAVLDERCKGRVIPVMAPSFAHTNNSLPIVWIATPIAVCESNHFPAQHTLCFHSAVTTKEIFCIFFYYSSSKETLCVRVPLRSHPWQITRQIVFVWFIQSEIDAKLTDGQGWC